MIYAGSQLLGSKTQGATINWPCYWNKGGGKEYIQNFGTETS